MKNVIRSRNHNLFQQIILKIELLASKNVRLICFIESPLKMMSNTFYFVIKDLFVLKGTVVQIEKALINDCLHVQKYPENFAFELFITL